VSAGNNGSETVVKVSLDVGMNRLTNDLQVECIAVLWCCSVCCGGAARHGLFLATKDRHRVDLLAMCIERISGVVGFDNQQIT
jgi:hypothetical protein